MEGETEFNGAELNAAGARDGSRGGREGSGSGEDREREVSLVPAQRSVHTKLQSEDLLTSDPDGLINSPHPSTDQLVEATALMDSNSSSHHNYDSSSL